MLRPLTFNLYRRTFACFDKFVKKLRAFDWFCGRFCVLFPDCCGVGFVVIGRRIGGFGYYCYRLSCCS